MKTKPNQRCVLGKENIGEKYIETHIYACIILEAHFNCTHYKHFRIGGWRCSMPEAARTEIWIKNANWILKYIVLHYKFSLIQNRTVTMNANECVRALIFINFHETETTEKVPPNWIMFEECERLTWSFDIKKQQIYMNNSIIEIR